MKQSNKSPYYEDDPDRTIRENERLIYYILKNKLNRDDLVYDEDIVQCGRIGIYKAWKSYDSTKAAWSTYMTRCVTNEIFIEFRRRRSPKNKFYDDCDRLNRIIDDGKGGECELQNFLSFEDKSFDDVISDHEARWNEIYNSLSLREKNIIHWLDLNYTQADIGELIGVSQSYASRLIKQLKSKIQKKWRDGEYT